MPLNGSDVASKPAGTTAVTGTTIESAKYNSAIDDIYSIFNTVRTIATGHTGASTAAGARTNLGAQASPAFSTKSSGYTVLATDDGGLINCTADLTLALTAAATLGAKWNVTVKANGGNVTIDPNGSETINGATTYIVYNGASVTVICDGTNFQIVKHGNGEELLYNGAVSSESEFALTGLSAYRTINIRGRFRPVSDGVLLLFRTSSNNGSTYDDGASDYAYQFLRVTGTTVSGDTDEDYLAVIISPTSVGNVSTEGIFFNLTLSEFNQDLYMYASGTVNMVDASAAAMTATIGGRRNQATARDAFKLFFASGNIDIAHITVTGVRG